MTELERIEIEGFKGLESLEFEPSQINLITGRNNTGKTSVLEAIEILFDPKKIERFGRDAPALIRAPKSKSTVRGEMTRGPLITELRQPEQSEAERYFARAVTKLLIERDTVIAALLDSMEGVERETVLDTSIRQVISERINDAELADLRLEFLVLISGDETRILFLPGETSSEILSQIKDELIDEILYEVIGGDVVEEEVRLGNDEGSPTVSILQLAESALSNLFRPYQSIFLEEPSDTGSVKFIRSIGLTDEIEAAEEEKDAVRIDDIGDFIADHAILDDLKTFDVDYLVFEDSDSGKYQVPYDFMGDGFKAVVGLLWELMDDETANDVVLIEEPENHMHPGYVRKVVRFLVDLAREENVQLFITTHDNDFINDFFMENLTDEQREFLKDEFTLIQMEQDAAQVMDYETAEQTLKDLHLDLRGL